MCYNCGCGDINDDMGDQDNITDETLAVLASEWKISLPETKKKLMGMLLNNQSDEQTSQMFEKASKAWGQSVADAQKKTLELLQSEMK